ncbi:MAG: tetratricopeptide repeat protein [Rhodothermales bacterium]
MESQKTAMHDLTESVEAPCVAILPFTNLSGDPNQSYFCEGLAAEILVCLARTPGIRVVARSSVFSLDWEKLDIREAGKHLCASAVLKGTANCLDDRLEITVELIDVATGNVIWAGRYDRNLVDVFVVQDEIVAGVVRALPIVVDDTRIRKIVDQHAVNVEAYECYLRGRHLYWLFSRQSVEAALKEFQCATETGDSYALAYCGITDCYWYLYEYVESLKQYVEAADEASRRALALDPTLAEAHASRGLALSLQGDFAATCAAFEESIRLDPNLFEAHFLYARTCFAEGELERAAELFEKAHVIRPEDYQSLLLAGQVYEVLGDVERASDLRSHGVAIAEEHLFLNPKETRALYMGANGLVQLGHTEKGLEWLEKALVLEPDDPMLLYNAGCIYALVDRPDAALTCLEHAVSGGLRQKGWFEHDPNLDSIRSHPRFRALTEKLV